MFRTFRETIGFSTSRYQWIGFVGMTKPETIVLFPSNMRLSCNTSLPPRWNRWPRETSTSAAPRQAGYPKTSGFTGMVRDFEVRKYLEIYVKPFYKWGWLQIHIINNACGRNRWDESHPPETDSIKYAIKYTHMGPEALWTHPIQRQKLFYRNFTKIRKKMSEGINGRVGLTINHMWAWHLSTILTWVYIHIYIYIYTYVAKMIWMIYWYTTKTSNFGTLPSRFLDLALP